MFKIAFLIKVRIATDRETGKARGFGYVQFASVEIAQTVFERGGLNIDGRDVNIDYAEDRPPSGGDRGACHFVVSCCFLCFCFFCVLWREIVSDLFLTVFSAKLNQIF
jgi:RNA recognition motif-containing protein